MLINAGYINFLSLNVDNVFEGETKVFPIDVDPYEFRFEEIGLRLLSGGVELNVKEDANYPALGSFRPSYPVVYLLSLISNLGRSKLKSFPI